MCKSNARNLTFERKLRPFSSRYFGALIVIPDRKKVLGIFRTVFELYTSFAVMIDHIQQLEYAVVEDVL